MTRIKGVLKEGYRYDSKLRGFFAFYIERHDKINGKTAEEKIEEYIDTLDYDIDKLLNGEFNYKIDEGEPVRYSGELSDHVFQPFCVIVKN